MRIIYSDETGTDETARFVVVAAVMVNAGTENRLADDAHRWITQWTQIDSLVRFSIEDAREKWPNLKEVKGRKLFRRLRRSRDPESWNLLANLAVIPQMQGAPVFYGAVDKQGLQARLGREPALSEEEQKRSPFEWAFLECIARVERYVHDLLPFEHLVWVHDDPGPHREALEGLSEKVNTMFPVDTLAELGHPHARILEPICSGSSQQSRMLQLADACASMIGERLHGGLYRALYDTIMRDAQENGGAPKFADEIS